MPEILNNQSLLEAAKNREKVMTFFEALEKGPGIDSLHLAILDKGVVESPFLKQIPNYPDRLRVFPESVGNVNLSNYPNRGSVPQLDTGGLDFLHPEVTEACVCVGNFDKASNSLRARWLGRNALEFRQFLSSTKWVAPLALVDQTNSKAPTIPFTQCAIRPKNGGPAFDFEQLIREMVSYGHLPTKRPDQSNSIGLLFKEFFDPKDLESWINDTAGNVTGAQGDAKNLDFSGRYHDPAAVDDANLSDPVLVDTKSKQELVVSSPGHYATGEEIPGRRNRISSYHLTRLMSMVAWHHHLTPAQRLKGAQWQSLACLVRALGTDTARFVDLGLKTLGIINSIDDVVILSKLGLGNSAMCYVAHVEFSSTVGGLEKFHSLSITLRLEKGGKSDFHLDARMAAEVTELLRRVVAGEL